MGLGNFLGGAAAGAMGVYKLYQADQDLDLKKAKQDRENAVLDQALAEAKARGDFGRDIAAEEAKVGTNVAPATVGDKTFRSPDAAQAQVDANALDNKEALNEQAGKAMLGYQAAQKQAQDEYERAWAGSAAPAVARPITAPQALRPLDEYTQAWLGSENGGAPLPKPQAQQGLDQAVEPPSSAAPDLKPIAITEGQPRAYTRADAYSRLAQIAGNRGLSKEALDFSTKAGAERMKGMVLDAAMGGNIGPLLEAYGAATGKQVTTGYVGDRPALRITDPNNPDAPPITRQFDSHDDMLGTLVSIAEGKGTEFFTNAARADSAFQRKLLDMQARLLANQNTNQTRREIAAGHDQTRLDAIAARGAGAAGARVGRGGAGGDGELPYGAGFKTQKDVEDFISNWAPKDSVLDLKDADGKPVDMMAYRDKFSQAFARLAQGAPETADPREVAGVAKRVARAQLTGDAANAPRAVFDEATAQWRLGVRDPDTGQLYRYGRFTIDHPERFGATAQEIQAADESRAATLATNFLKADQEPSVRQRMIRDLYQGNEDKYNADREEALMRYASIQRARAEAADRQRDMNRAGAAKPMPTPAMSHAEIMRRKYGALAGPSGAAQPQAKPAAPVPSAYPAMANLPYLR